VNHIGHRTIERTMATSTLILRRL